MKNLKPNSHSIILHKNYLKKQAFERTFSSYCTNLRFVFLHQEVLFEMHVKKIKIS